MEVISRGTTNTAQSVITRDAFAVIERRAWRRSTRRMAGPTCYASTLVSVDVMKKNGKRGNVYLVGFTPGVELVSTTMKVIEGRQYRPAVHEVTVSDPIRRMYKNMNIGDKLKLLNNTEWTIVGVFAGSDSIGDSVLRADADTVMSAFNRNTYQSASVQLESAASVPDVQGCAHQQPGRRRRGAHRRGDDEEQLRAARTRCSTSSRISWER